MKKTLLLTLLLVLVTGATASAYDFEADGFYFNKISDNEVEVTCKERYYESYTEANIVIPETITIINSDDTGSEMSYTVVGISDNAFTNCNKILTVAIPNTVLSIGVAAFRNCTKLKSVVLPDHVTEISSYAFESCFDLESVSLPNSVTTIANCAFQWCTSLTEVVIPNSVTTIERAAFNACSLTSINIPASVSSIGDRAFISSGSLQSIVVDPNNSYYDSREGCNALIETSTNTLLVGCKNSFIPNTVKAIGQTAFSSSKGLTSIVIPNSVTVIGSGAFDGCSDLMSVVLPDSITMIDTWTFGDCTNLTEIVIPNSVDSILHYAFAYCKNMTYVKMPKSLVFVDEKAFYNDGKLNRVEIEEVESWCGITFTEIESNPLNYSHRLFMDGQEVTDLVISGRIPEICKHTFYKCNSMKSLIIGDTASSVEVPVTLIGSNSFRYCNGLESLTIGNTVLSLASCSFGNCNNLKNVSIGDGVTSIGNDAFCQCKKLEKVVIGNSVTSIGRAAFYDCVNLKTFISHAIVPPSGNNCFTNYNDEVNNYIHTTLFVPAESLEAYRVHEEWGQFSHIVPFIGAGPGDVNGDGKLSISDVTGIIDQLLSSDELPAYCDVNGDGMVNITDVTALINMLLNSN